jgi:hypothetical protein
VYQHNQCWGDATAREDPPNRDRRGGRFDTPAWLVAWTHELIDAVAYGDFENDTLAVVRFRLPTLSLDSTATVPRSIPYLV